MLSSTATIGRSTLADRLLPTLNRTNLEQRRGQPGRYRPTSQEVEAEPLLPSPEAIAELMAENAQPVQPRNRTHNRQVFERLSDCATRCTVAPIASVGDEKRACQACDGLGCPTCKPEDFGLSPRRVAVILSCPVFKSRKNTG